MARVAQEQARGATAIHKSKLNHTMEGYTTMKLGGSARVQVSNAQGCLLSHDLDFF